MKTEHKDIKTVLPYGENLRGFIQQKFISESELHKILKKEEYILYLLIRNILFL